MRVAARGPNFVRKTSQWRKALFESRDIAGSIEGRFYGSDHREVSGIFERDRLSGLSARRIDLARGSLASAEHHADAHKTLERQAEERGIPVTGETRIASWNLEHLKDSDGEDCIGRTGAVGRASADWRNWMPTSWRSRRSRRGGGALGVSGGSGGLRCRRVLRRQIPPDAAPVSPPQPSGDRVRHPQGNRLPAQCRPEGAGDGERVPARGTDIAVRQGRPIAIRPEYLTTPTSNAVFLDRQRGGCRNRRNPPCGPRHWAPGTGHRGMAPAGRAARDESMRPR